MWSTCWKCSHVPFSHSQDGRADIGSLCQVRSNCREADLGQEQEVSEVKRKWSGLDNSFRAVIEDFSTAPWRPSLPGYIAILDLHPLSFLNECSLWSWVSALEVVLLGFPGVVPKILLVP